MTSKRSKEKSLKDQSEPKLVQKISNMPGIVPNQFTSQPGRAPGQLRQAIQQFTSELPNQVPAGMEGAKGSLLTHHQGPKLIRQLPRIAKFTLDSLKDWQKSNKQMGTLFGVNDALDRGSESAAEFIQMKSETKVEPTVLLKPEKETKQSKLVERLLRQFDLDPSLVVEYSDTLGNGVYTGEQESVIRRALEEYNGLAHPSIVGKIPNLRPHRHNTQLSEKIRKDSVLREDLEDRVRHDQFDTKGEELEADEALKDARDFPSSSSSSSPVLPSYESHSFTPSRAEIAALRERAHKLTKAELKDRLNPSLYNTKSDRPSLIEQYIKQEERQIRKRIKRHSGQGIPRRPEPVKHHRRPVAQTIPVDTEIATKKLEVAIGEVQSGNDSKILKNQIADLVQYLLLHKQIDKNMATSIIKTCVYSK